MAQDLASIKANLDLAIDTRDRDRIASLFEDLGRLYKNVDKDTLKDSKIGLCINKVRKTEWIDEAVKKEATKMLLYWKPLLLSSLTMTKGEEEASTRKRVLDHDGQTEPGPEKTGSDAKSSVRQKCVQILIDALAVDFKPSEVDDNIIECANVIESTFYEMYNGKISDAAYQAKFRERFLNLKRNSALRSNMLSGSMSPVTFVSMTTTELASDEQRQRDLVIQRQNLLNAQTSVDNAAETDQFKCSKCKQKRCKYYQLQTRSADEPMTTFVTCVNCGNRWKFC